MRKIEDLKAISTLGCFVIQLGIIQVGATSPNHPTPPELIYSAAQGHTIYNIASNRALVIGNGSGTNGTVTITGGTLDSRGSGNDAIANSGGSGTLDISGGHYTNLLGGTNTYTGAIPEPGTVLAGLLLGLGLLRCRRP